MLKQVNKISIGVDPYCCKITIKRVDRSGLVTVRHVPRELPRFIFHFIQEGDSVTDTVPRTTPRISRILEVRLEVPILMHFTRESKAISSKVQILVRKQVGKMKKTFHLETLAKENFLKTLPKKTLRVQKKTKKKK